MGQIGLRKIYLVIFKQKLSREGLKSLSNGFVSFPSVGAFFLKRSLLQLPFKPFTLRGINHFYDDQQYHLVTKTAKPIRPKDP